MFHVDGRTDRGIERQTDITKLMVAFSNFANAPTKLLPRGYVHI